MRQLLILMIICMISFTAAADVITMDLTTATDIASNPITYSTNYGDGYYNCTDVWDSTYNDSGICQFIYTNDARFSLSHLPSMSSYGGQSWEGFTLSKVSQDTANVFGCIARGGIKGIGTPYVIGYFSDWVTETQGYSSNVILFDQEYYPEYVYICQNSNTMEAITHGGVFNARAFTHEDTLALIISGLDASLNETTNQVYYLAIDGSNNNGWVKVPLTTLGKTSGLSFRMATTDIGQFGANTPLYFALDGLTVNTDQPTKIPTIQDSSITSTRKMALVDSRLMIIHKGSLYNLLGQRIK